MDDPVDIAALVPVVDALEELGVFYYIGGSAASSAHGYARSTLDIDIIADLRYGHVNPLVERLIADYYIDAKMIAGAISTLGSFNAIYLPTMYKIDVYLLRDCPFDSEGKHRVIKARLTASLDREFVLASAEDTVLNKLERYRAGNELSERQWNDIMGVMKLKRHELDREYFDYWAPRLDVADLLEKAWAQVEALDP